MSLEPLIEALCNIFGESINAAFKKIIEDLELTGREDLATMFGRLMGIYDGEKMPARYKCFDFSTIFGIDGDYIYGEPSKEARSIWELEILPRFYDLLGGTFHSMHLLTPTIERATDIARAILRSRARDNRLERFSITKEGDKIIVELCYNDEEVAKALKLGKAVGGFFTGILVEALAIMMGYDCTKPVGDEVHGHCIRFKFEIYKKD